MTAAHGALQRQLDGLSFRSATLWVLAAMVAFSAHAGAGIWLMRETPDQVQIAGAAEISIDVAMLGTAEADQVSSGDALEPVEAPETETVEPVRDTTPATVTSIERPLQPVGEWQQPEAAQAVPPEPVEAQSIEAPEPSQVQIAATRPVEPRLAPVEEAKPVEPVEEAGGIPLPEVVPIPEPRPKPKVAENPKPKKPEQVVEKKPARQRGGNKGKNEIDARRGQAGGEESAVQSAAIRQGNSGEVGNAAVSNYPGKVASKLRRALPRRSSGGGEVLVSFRVSLNGGVSGIRVSRSSGSPAVDKAALDTVRRAAPFPPIPADAGRSSWDFDLPLTFKR